MSRKVRALPSARKRRVERAVETYVVKTVDELCDLINGVAERESNDPLALEFVASAVLAVFEASIRPALETFLRETSQSEIEKAVHELINLKPEETN